MKYKKLLLVFSILFVLLCSLTAISASDLDDTDAIANDEVENEIISSDVDIENDITTEPDSGNLNGNTFRDLNGIIADAGNINLTHNYEYDQSTDQGLFSQGIVIDRDNVVIDGKGHSINGEMHNRVFHIKNANNVTLKNIKFINSGYQNLRVDGGALYIEESSNITIINCLFNFNQIRSDDGNGGAIYVKSTDPIRIIDSEFKENSAGYGGAITAHDATLILENTTFDKNTAQRIGGAINAAHSTQIINNCTFKDGEINEGSGDRRRGGAIYAEQFDEDNEMIITNTEFKNNYVYNDGGAVYINGQAKVLIEDSKFSKNTGNGGAIVCDIANVTIRNTEFNENHGSDGGAVNAGPSTLFEDCNFTGNYASYGGAIYVCDSGGENANATVKNCNFLNNSAEVGGAIFNDEKTVTVLNCNFTGNYAMEANGGAINSQNGKALIYNSNFIANNATKGGAIMAASSVMLIENSYFIANNATDGGAIYTFFSGIEIDNSHFIANNAVAGGSISAASNIKALINNSDFSQNAASRYGGAIIVVGEFSDSEITVENSIFAQNTDTEGTGDIALVNENCKATLINVTPSNLVPKYLVGMEVEEVSDFDYGQPLTLKAFNIKRFNQPLNNGSVIFSINGENISIPVQNGIATLPERLLDAGSYKVDVTYVGDAENANPTKTIEFNVLKLPAVLEVISVTNCTYGDSIQIKANVTCGGLPVVEGRIFIIVNGKKYSANVTNGIATIDVSGLNVGKYSVNLTYEGNYLADNVTAKFEVSKCPVTIEIVNIANCTYGDSVQIKVNVVGGSSAVNDGNVSAVVNGAVYSASVINGTATIDIPNLSVGKYEANLTFGGNYLADNVTAKFEVSKCPVTIEIVNIANCTYGDSVQIKVNVVGGSSAVNDGNVSAVVNGAVYSASVINGTATIDIPNLSVGKYEANLTFGGNYLADNVTVKFEVSLPNAVIAANDISFIINYGGKYSAVLKDINGKAVAGEKVTFTLNGKNIASAVTDVNGVASIQLTPAILKAAKAGKKDLAINLVSENYNPVSKTVKVTINKEKTKILKAKKTYNFKKSKKAKNIKVTLKNSKNKVMKKVKVTIKLSGKKIKGKKAVTAKTNNKGVVTFKLGKKLTKKTKVKYTITFKGNAYYNKVVKKGKIVVK